MNINTILVVLGTGAANWSVDEPLLQRASALAQKCGASLHLLHVGYDNSLGYGAFAPREEIDAGRLRLLADCRERQARLQDEIARTHSLEVFSETIWDQDLSGSILSVAEARKVDLIMKTGGDHSYFLGLFSTTDWDLLRESNVPVWFVASEAARSPEGGVIAAVDQSISEDESDEEFRLDHEAFDTAKRLSDRYGSPLYAAHAYQLPRTLPGFEGYVPMVGPAASITPAVVNPAVDLQARSEIAQRHGRVVQDFIDEHGIPVDDVIIQEGAVDQVLSCAAESKKAGLIVMGSSSKSWWDRLLGRASAEPTLSNTGCDVLFVKAQKA